ncbi:protein kinase [Nocardia sp. NPDC058480]|uniref:serine/threonine-protein kinase n=1 Tax=Nocardia sp. NPDC058480 TaxID=3346522 RepID=UPI003650A896
MHDIGEVFAGFTIEAMLGQGGMGTVYLARHPRLDRLTALKLLNRDLFADERVRARFEREADLAAGLDHPGIVTVYDRGTEGEQLWISMQYVDGIDAATVDPMALPPERAVQIIEGVADALDYAHGRGVLHRDVKPANILLARSTGGQGERVFLTDFGIARLRADSTHLTQQGMFTATLAYASPEQMTGADLDHRSDQYSLACSLYWLFTGLAPFDSADPNEIIRGTLYAPPPPLALRRAGLPPIMDAVLAAAMAKHPAARFDSCVAFAKAARQALTSKTPPVLPRPPANPAPGYYPPAPQPGPATPFPQPGMAPPVYQGPPMQPGPQPNWQPPSRPPAAVPPAAVQRPVAQSAAPHAAAGPVAAPPNAVPPAMPAPGRQFVAPPSGGQWSDAEPPGARPSGVQPPVPGGVSSADSSAGPLSRSGSPADQEPTAEPAPAPPRGGAGTPSSSISLDKPVASPLERSRGGEAIGGDRGPGSARSVSGSSAADGEDLDEVSATAATDVMSTPDAGELDAANSAALTKVTSIPGPPNADRAGQLPPQGVSQQDGAGQAMPPGGVGQGGVGQPGSAGRQPGAAQPGQGGPWEGPSRGYWAVPRRVSGIQRFGWVLLVALVLVLVALVVALVVVVLPGDDDGDLDAEGGAKKPSSSVAEAEDSFSSGRRVFPTLVPQGEMGDGVGYRGTRCVGVRDVSELAWKEPALQWTPISAGWQCERADNQAGAVSYLVLEYANAGQARSVSEALPATVRYAGDKDGVPFSLQRWVVQDPASTRTQTAHQVLSFPDDSDRANYLVVVSRRGSSGTGGAPRPSAQDEVIAWWEEVPL